MDMFMATEAGICRQLEMENSIHHLRFFLDTATTARMRTCDELSRCVTWYLFLCNQVAAYKVVVFWGHKTRERVEALKDLIAGRFREECERTEPRIAEMHEAMRI